MEEKMQEYAEIMSWFANNADRLDLVDNLNWIGETIVYVDRIRPIYEKYNKVETKGFKILARL